MRLNIMLHGGDFDGQLETMTRSMAPKTIRVASLEADIQTDGYLQADTYALLEEEKITSTIWGASYRWAGPVNSAASLIDLWVD